MAGLIRENEKLIEQLLMFKDDMEGKVDSLKKKDKMNTTASTLKSNKGM